MILGRTADRAEKRFKSLTKTLIEKLTSAIVSGKFAPGEPLSESALAATLKVEPVALREALRVLEAQGYVTFKPDDAAVVSNPTREEIEDSYTIAGVLEGLAVRRAVERASPQEVEHLRDLHNTLKEACHNRDLIGYFNANSNFHRFIADLARNERLYRLIEQLRHEIQRTRVLLLRTPERLDYSMREHDQIMDAFLKKNPALAESTMVRHMQNQMETLRKLTDTGEQR
jgi:DNA-binding GntR family transcriptional regulator